MPTIPNDTSDATRPPGAHKEPPLISLSDPDTPALNASNRETYKYTPLPLRTIRLLHLMPHEDEDAEIQGQLVEYSLERSGGSPALYEALSYVWGDPNNPRKISIDGNKLQVTISLHSALQQIRHTLMTRVLWIDAICINQGDDVEKGQQVGYMAEIYSKASRVIVWLGEPENGCDKALEDICLEVDQRSMSSLEPQVKEQISTLLHRPWFERIWVLQEVAAARHVVLKCGSVEVDGYAFCVALNSQSLGLLEGVSPTVQNVVHSAIYLIQGAAFRSRRVASSSMGRFSLGIRPLGELVEVYHTRKATRLHDKVFALLGMSSDDQIAAGLSPDYSIPWYTLMERLIQVLLGQQVAVATWIDMEMAVIQSRGHIIGKITAVGNPQDRTKQEVTLLLKDQWNELSSVMRWDLPPLAKSARIGDIICFLEGASNPTIARPCKDHFLIIMITAPKLRRSFLTGTQCNLLLVWDWDDTYARIEEGYFEEFMKVRSPDHLSTSTFSWERDTTRALNMAMVLEEVEDYQTAERTLQEFVDNQRKQYGHNSPYLLECEKRLESLRQILKHLDHMQDKSSNGHVADKLYCRNSRQRESWVVRIWAQRDDMQNIAATGFFIRIPGLGKRVILTARSNLIDSRGAKNKILNIGWVENGQFTAYPTVGYDIFVSASGRPDLDTEVDAGYGVIILHSTVDKDISEVGFDFALKLGLDDLQGRYLELFGYEGGQAEPSISSGSCLACWEDSLKHDCLSRPGYSGSPMLMAYQGAYAAVAIQ
ncbi:HET-domain-containing protein [Aspergillus piperis CBS 112811]|uniref:HET-domain-containing protein n=1 Tax=Aspergillus piperis CBS 112811 TaxID=1448313 RepID=A0A8G1VMT3_9EURO|nr:HET-domain-containing protein [Aspergillus piperis CBS 112811]RAH56018.1 HET-domain-containing protein [Aspergillus piperis CBS 112811]